MKYFELKRTIILAVVLMASTQLVAQQNQNGAADTDVTAQLGYDPEQIADEWNDWYNNPTQQNAFIGAFMNTYQVPQNGLYGLSREDTWIWWASHHSDAVNDYLQQKQQNATN